jgi:processive 1,2-diacylglycerol beta-glucosyltransferase
MSKRLLILSASAGAGHVRAAQAIERACAGADCGWKVEHIDILQYTNPLFRTMYSRMYLDLVNRSPEVLGWLYDQLDKPWKNRRRKLAFDKLNVGPFVKMLEGHRPDVVVCTHSLPAEIISWMKVRERRQLAVKQAIVITDFDVHALWLCDHYERYFVALDETREHLERLEVPGAKITVSGIPIDPAFAGSMDRAATRRKHGLEPGRTTILVSAGGYGVGRVEVVLRQLLELKHPAQVVAICGRNAELKDQVDALAADRPGGSEVALKVVGYTSEMHEFMAASDLIVGKPGGLTSSEALASGLVFVVVDPIPGQEERNSDHLLENGAAIRCNNLPTLAYKIDRLLDDAERLSAMQANARKMGRPRAAFEVVDVLRTMAEV